MQALDLTFSLVSAAVLLREKDLPVRGG